MSRTVEIGRLNATGTTAPLDVGSGKPAADTPFTESRTVTAEIHVSSNWNGSNEKFQGSDDGGATWRDLTSAADTALVTPGVPLVRDITMPNMIRGSATRAAGSIAFILRGGY